MNMRARDNRQSGPTPAALGQRHILALTVPCPDAGWWAFTHAYTHHRVRDKPLAEGFPCFPENQRHSTKLLILMRFLALLISSPI